MKKIMTVLTMMLLSVATGKAMTYEQARNEALFLTDKMAYELNLTDEQYEAAYEINLDYLMGVTSVDDVYGSYWERRNRDLSYVLLDWQWTTFCAASYFFRPLTWSDGFWHFGIYVRYPHRDFFYFGRPVFYATYRGGHAWHRHGVHGYYYGHRDHFRPVGRSHFGMLDRWNRGNHHGHSLGNRHHGGHGGYGGQGSFGGRGNHGGHRFHGDFGRSSSTRTTVHHHGGYGGGGSFGGGRSHGHSGGGSFSGGSSHGYGGGGSFGGGRPQGYSGGQGGRSFGGGGGSHGGGSHGSHGGRSFGSHR